MKKATQPKLPEKLYVVVKREIEREWDSINNIHVDTGEKLIGFVHSYNSKKGFERKHNTQKEWAYGSYLHYAKGLEIIDHGNETFNLRGYLHEYRDRQGWIDVPLTREIEEQIKPRIWLNEPLDGFRLTNFVTRHNTANKLWKVLDPRGIIFEISTGSLEKIMMNTTIERGLIHGKCVWMNNTNLVLAEDTPLPLIRYLHP